MEIPTPKNPNLLLSNILVRLLSFGVLVILARLAYVITVKGRSCDSLDFCFFPQSLKSNVATSTTAAAVAANISAASSARLKTYYSSIFLDLIAQGFLSLNSKSLCIGAVSGEEIISIKEVGVFNSVGISLKKWSRPFIRFKNQTFGFVFSSTAGLDEALKPVEFALEVYRTLKHGGFFVVHTESANDAYSFASLLELFNSFTLIKSSEVDGFDSSSPLIHEIIFKKEKGVFRFNEKEQFLNGDSVSKCSVPSYKHELIKNAEPLIREEPLKPWITFKRNIKNVKYLPSMVDISFKNQYRYVAIGAKSYSLSIGSWFKKRYPKQDKSFEIYAIEANSTFHDEYRLRKGVTLLPYAAWIRNETLYFEINREASRKNGKRGRGAGRNQAVQSSSNFVSVFNKIQGFDLAMWLKSVVKERDYVVVKMDVEGTEFHLVRRLVETGAICLIDEMFLECHYNRWQRCCPEKRSPKYQNTYVQCLELFSSLRENGVLVHQWW
ncbi:methyltransferase [Forsythia ovata]|uniref:Methyltransferase n=1 Tax=Forsythia ovata TaxID=205694 RepID=A0ABD1T638_9LAMI